MSEGGEEWTGYIAYRTNRIYVSGLLCGFTFTALIILITSLPDPQRLSSQIVLLFSAVLLDLLIFLLLLSTVELFNYIRKVPRTTSTTNLISLLSLVTIALWGYLLPFILFLFDVSLVAYLATILWTAFLALGIVVIYMPYEKRRRKG